MNLIKTKISKGKIIMKVLFATTNPAKVKKYKKALEEKGIKLLTLKDLNINIKVEETGKMQLRTHT